MSCTSVGYLLHRDAERVVLIQSHAVEANGNELLADSLTIPAGVVRKVRRLT